MRELCYVLFSCDDLVKQISDQEKEEMRLKRVKAAEDRAKSFHQVSSSIDV